MKKGACFQHGCCQKGPLLVTMSVKCSGCHVLRKRTHGIGPDLWDIVGSEVARHSGFQYSQSLKKFGGRWSRARLDKFLRDPEKLVPGTTMKTPGIEDKQQRQAIIEYLAKLPR